MLLLHKHKIKKKHKINLNYNGATVEFFAEQWAWFVVWRQVRLIRKFRIGSSLLNGIGIVRFKFKSNLEASQVPNMNVLGENDQVEVVNDTASWRESIFMWCDWCECKFLCSIQWHNAEQLADWCMWYLAINYSHVYTTSAKLLRQLEPSNQVQLTTCRWPPTWLASVL